MEWHTGKDLTGVIQFNALVRKWRKLRDEEYALATQRSKVWEHMVALHNTLASDPDKECPIWIESEYGTKRVRLVVEE